MDFDILGYRRPTARPTPATDTAAPLPQRTPLTRTTAAMASLDYEHVAFAVWLEQQGKIGRDDDVGGRRP